MAFNVGGLEGAFLCCHPAVKGDLKQKIPQFFPEIALVIALNRVGHFIGFLDCVGGDRVKGLLKVPWASAFRIAQPVHDLEQPHEFVGGTLVAGCV